MRLFFVGPRVMGLRPGVSFSPKDFHSAPRKRSAIDFADRQFVYVILGSHGAVKIGVTTSPSARIAKLRTGSPYRLEFAGIATCSGRATEVEHAAHLALDLHRLEGEWFDVTPSEASHTIAVCAGKLGQTLAPAGLANIERLSIVASGETDEEGRKRGRLNLALFGFALFVSLLTMVVLFVVLMN